MLAPIPTRCYSSLLQMWVLKSQTRLWSKHTKQNIQKIQIKHTNINCCYRFCHCCTGYLYTLLYAVTSNNESVFSEFLWTKSKSILFTKSKSEHQSPLAMLMTIYNVISRKTNLKMPTISQVYIKHHNLNSLNHFKLFPNHFISCVILFLQQWETTESGGRGRRKRWRWPSWRRTNWRRSSVWSWRRSAGLTERPSLLFASWENTPRWVATWHLTVKIMFLCRKKRICRERKIKAVLSVQCFISFRYTFYGW